jgi:hypothetical protein
MLPGRDGNADVYLLWAMNRTKLVAVWVAHICQVHRTEFAFTQAWWLFDRGAPMGNSCVMELLNLFWRNAPEPDRAAIGERCGPTVDRFTHAERATLVPVEKARLPRDVLISQRFSSAKYAEHGVIEALRALNVIRSDHHVAEHLCISNVFGGWPVD